MARYFLLFIALTFQVLGFSQGGYADNWPLGYYSYSQDSSYGGSMVRFLSGEQMVSYFDIQFGYSGDNANISDANGNLLAYTNGCQIQNRAHDLMENGDNINPGSAHNQQCNSGGGYSNAQGAIFLPKPGSDSLYFLFHLKSSDGSYTAKQLLYTVVDAAANNGFGKVIEKNIFLEQDTLSQMISAVRHANGRDWWLMLQKNYHLFNTPLPPNSLGKYHLYLFDKYGIHPQAEQQIGQLWTPQNWAGQSCFSPDGNRYAIGNNYNGLNLFQFDRCSGTLFNAVHLSFSADTTYAMGVAFSSNSRFLYVTTGLLIIQFDLQAPNILESKQIVAVYDGYLSMLPTTFFHLALAPDEKIYGTATNAVNTLHVIRNPNNPGSACDVQQHVLHLPTYHAYTIPNFPFYKLFDVPGSACDSLGIDGPVVKVISTSEPERGLLYPNPTTGDVYWKGIDGVILRVVDAMGRLVFVKELSNGNADIRALPDGIYFMEVYDKSNQTLFSKPICLIK